MFFSSGCTFSDAVRRRRIAFWKMIETKSIASADIYVSQSIACLDDSMELALVLKGGIVVNESCILHGCQCVGASFVKYLPAASLQRWVYISKSFVRTQTKRAKAIIDVLQALPAKANKWKLVDIAEVQRRASRSQVSALAFVTEKERRTVAALGLVKNKLVGNEICLFLRRCDLANSMLVQ